MKHTLFILALITATIQTFAQSPRIKLNQITKDSLTGSVLISSPTDSGMVYSRDLFISYGADTVLILGGDTLAATSSIISSVLSDGVTITGDGTTGSELTVDTVTVIATKGDLSDYVTIAGTETITGAKTFTSALTQSGGDVNFDSGTFFVDESEDRVGIGTSSPSAKLDVVGDVEIDGKLNISDANSNVLTGDGSGESISTGNNNTALGYDAGRYIDGGGNNTDSDNSVFIGYDSRPLADAQINQIVIGSEAIGLGSNSVVLGNGSITKTRLQGNVGIGTDSPSADLDVVGDVEVNGNLTVTGTINDEPTNKQISLGEGYADNIRKFYYDSSITVHPSNIGYSYAELIKEDLLKEASLILSPTATSVGKLYTQKPLGSSDAFDFVRDSTSTRVNSLGLIETVPDSVPRIDYTDGEPSLLLEPSRTNIVPYSADIVEDSSSVILTHNYGTSLDGLNNSLKIQKSGTDENNRIWPIDWYNATLVNGNEYTISAFVKNINVTGVTTIACRVQSGTLFRQGYQWTGSSLAITTSNQSGTRTNQILQYYGNGWWRIGFTFEADNINGAFELDIDRLNGNDTTAIESWGWQLEEGSYATSYIPTNGSTVTRAADDVELTGVADLIGDSEGTLILKASVLDAVNDQYLALSDGTITNRIYFRLGGSYRVQMFKGGVQQANILSGSYNAGEVFTIALRYAQDNVALFANGVKLGQDNSANIYSDGTLTDVLFTRGDAVGNFYGNVKQLTVFPTALTDSELEALTQP